MRCEIVANNFLNYKDSSLFGWGNGYIYLPLHHPASGMTTEAIYRTFPEIVSGLQEITFSSLSEDGKTWIIGFDTLHMYYNKSNFPKGRVQEETLNMMYRFLIIEFLYTDDPPKNLEV